VIIADKSEGFDPRQHSIPDFDGKTIYEIPPGGLGNYFICKLMDDVEYIHRPYVENELILTMLKATTPSNSA
jgi:anti-sigma regulatory factor (Ser/Thr protein kinase)